MSDYSIYIGIVAGVCTGVSMLPQLIKIIREKKAKDISIVMLLVLISGVGAWTWYGVLKKDYPIIRRERSAANAHCLHELFCCTL